MVARSKGVDAALRANLRRHAKEPGFSAASYKRGWYEVGRRLAETAPAGRGRKTDKERSGGSL